tara:strand:+ start:102 stop:677 length:576 start_codon:yes stop_codon:yes gene_type:complete
LILIIDNYDSFTYNVFQYVGEINKDVIIVKNDELSIESIKQNKYSHIIISPGPGGPNESGKCIDIVKHFYKEIPILGVCLGHQVIGKAFGASVIKNHDIVHGKTSEIYNDNSSVLYNGIPSVFTATRYHSLIIEKSSMSNDFRINSWLSDKTVMGLEHKKYPLYGVQYHPESIKTDYGKLILNNFIKTQCN